MNWSGQEPPLRFGRRYALEDLHLYCFDYECDKCGRPASAACGALGYYRFADGTQFPALATPAWCTHCDDVRLAEYLPDLGFLREELSRYDAGTLTDADHEAANELAQSVEVFVASRKESLTRWIASFENRTLPERCLECGFSDFWFLTVMTDDGSMPDAFEHFGCGGHMRMVRTVHSSPASHFVLDGNGNRIPASETP